MKRYFLPLLFLASIAFAETGPIGEKGIITNGLSFEAIDTNAEINVKTKLCSAPA